MRISDWSSDVCSSDLLVVFRAILGRAIAHAVELEAFQCFDDLRRVEGAGHLAGVGVEQRLDVAGVRCLRRRGSILRAVRLDEVLRRLVLQRPVPVGGPEDALDVRSEEHTSELQSLMRISYAVFCLKTKNKEKQKIIQPLQ